MTETPGSLDCLLLRAAENMPEPLTIEEKLWAIVLERPIVEILPDCANLFLETLNQTPPGQWKKQFMSDFATQIIRISQNDKKKELV